jgi:hypothetical protein
MVDAVDFKSFLRGLGKGKWSQFYEVCSDAAEITKNRPFYPYRPGGKKQGHLLTALQVASIDDFRRKCELANGVRRAASPLFWTLGASQVGKAAIIGWRDVLPPAVGRGNSVVLWPFDGSLDVLLKPGNLIIVETYPAEYCSWLFEDQPLKGKGKLEIRRRAAPAMLKWARSANVTLDPDLRRAIEDGFPDGDDALDAAVGLFGMLEVLLNRRTPGEPSEESIRKLEGWIFGQQAFSGVDPAR